MLIEKKSHNPMSNISFSFPFFQLLMTQIFHDIISPMSALSTGISFLCSLEKNGKSIHEEASLLALVDTARQQLQHRVVFFRTLVGRQENFSQEERLKEIIGYITEHNVSIEKAPEAFPGGVFTILCCWLCRQFSGASSIESTSHIKGGWTFIARGTPRKAEHSDDLIIMEGNPPHHPQESYAYYLHYLAKKEGLSVKIQRSSQAISISFSP